MLPAETRTSVTVSVLSSLTAGLMNTTSLASGRSTKSGTGGTDGGAAEADTVRLGCAGVDADAIAAGSELLVGCSESRDGSANWPAVAELGRS